MKKILAILLACILLAALAAVPASASNPTHFYLTGPSSAKVGDQVEVKVNVEGSYQAHFIRLSVNFDKTALTYTDKSFGPVYLSAMNADGMCAVGLTMDGNAVSIAMLMPVDALSAAGEIVTLSFTVLSTAGSKTKIDLVVEEFGYMPVGQTTPTNLAHKEDGINIKISGGSCTQTTPTPGPGDHSGFATDDPNATDPGDTAKQTDAPKDTSKPDPNATEAPTDDPNATEEATEDPNATEEVTEDPNATEAPTDDPDATPGPETTDEPGPGGEPARSNNLTKGLLTAGGCVLAAALAFLCVLIAKRSKRKE